ncbi:MAG: glycosyl hydrolase [Thermomicrobiales bacterium]
MVDPKLLEKMEWRLVGPFRGGRCVAVAGDPSDILTFYFGSTGGGVWKTRDGGATWKNVSDGFLGTASVGALAVAESDPNVLYVGMGETTIRGNVAHGDGVYRSSDAGATWTHCGLAETRHIAKVRVHPGDPDLVYVAAFGHVYGSNAERGVYRSRDGGVTWDKILFRNEQSGAIDLAMDPHNPRILYAAFWDAQRTPYGLTSGGPGSSLHKSTDGGERWTELTNAPGLPKGLLGKIGIACSARSERVWALIEAEGGGLFRSENGGASWEKMSDNADQRQRPWYYTHIIADPTEPDTLWVPNVQLWKSSDSGRSFQEIPTPHGDDHDIWIDPANSMRMIEGNDGGACVSYSGGAAWSSIFNQPTAEFYHVTADNAVPYRLYGAQQDNTTISTPSRSDNGAITWADCYTVGGGESGYIAVRPDDPNIVYAGSYWLVTRYDHRTHQSRNILPWPENPMGWSAGDLKYRFQWTFPILVSAHNPDTLYVTSNVVHRSTDEGASWEVISPDLTRNDPTRMGPSGGPITRDNTSVEYYCTIFALAESPVQQGVLWAGSDDGLVHVSRDGGKNWQNVTPPDLPEWAMISIIDPSPHDAATAYVAANRYKSDDFAPYLYKTTDYGQTWTTITDGIAADAFTRVIRADPDRTGLLYAGTETGLYVSFDDGAHWQSLRQNLPVVPIHDLAVKNQDLVAATHGRAFWILDDLTPLHQLAEGIGEGDAHLFTPRPTTRFKSGLRRFHAGGPPQGYLSVGGLAVTTWQDPKPGSPLTFFEAGRNPTDGVIITYYLKEKPETPISLTFLDAQGNEIKTFKSEEVKEVGAHSHAPSPAGEKKEEDTHEKKEPKAPAEAGMNRFVWNMRYPDATNVPGAIFWAGSVDGPIAPPGHYQARLTVGETTQTVPFEIRKDPRVAATQEELDAQFALLLKIRDQLTRAHDGINQLRDVRAQVEGWEKRVEGREDAQPLRDAAATLKKSLAEVEEELIQVRSKALEDPLNFPIKLNNKLASLSGAVASADTAPTIQAHAVFDDLANQIALHLITLSTVIETDVAEFNHLVSQLSIPAIAPSRT